MIQISWCNRDRRSSVWTRDKELLTLSESQNPWCLLVLNRNLQSTLRLSLVSHYRFSFSVYSSVYEPLVRYGWCVWSGVDLSPMLTVFSPFRPLLASPGFLFISAKSVKHISAAHSFSGFYVGTNDYLYLSLWEQDPRRKNRRLRHCLITARIRRMGEGNVFSLFTSGGGGYPYPIMLCNISQNAMGQPGGVPCQVQPGRYPGQGRGGTLARGVPWSGGTLLGGTWPGGVPCWGVPWPGGTLGGTLAGGTLARGGTLAGGYPGQGGTLGEYPGRGVPWLGGTLAGRQYPGWGVPWPGGYPGWGVPS